MVALATEHVIDVQHWNDTLFSFRTTRDPGFRFESGQFVMIGLQAEGRPLMRAYSIASANWEEHLEFFSIKVPDGPLTSRLQHLKPGDPLTVVIWTAHRRAAATLPSPARPAAAEARAERVLHG